VKICNQLLKNVKNVVS